MMRTTNLNLRNTILAIALSGTTAISAQTTVTVNGTVTNATSNPVTVVAWLIHFTDFIPDGVADSVETDAFGNYSITMEFPFVGGSVGGVLNPCSSALPSTPFSFSGDTTVVVDITCPDPVPCTVDYTVLIGYDGSGPIPYEAYIQPYVLGIEPIDYSWDFGDGTVTTEPEPLHTYTDGGPYELCLTIEDALACSATFCDTLSINDDGIVTRDNGFSVEALPAEISALSIKEPQDKGAISLAPNPGNDQRQLRFGNMPNGKYRIRVMDQAGRIVSDYRSVVSEKQQVQPLNTPPLPAGSYVVEASSGDRVWHAVFIEL